MAKRFSIFSLIITALLLLLATRFVSIPPHTQIISPNTLQNTSQSTSEAEAQECSIANIRKSLNTQPTGAATSALPALDPRQISLINWNIYKAQAKNWPADFKSLIKDQNLVLIQEAINQPRVTTPLRQQQPWWQLNNAFFYNGLETGVLTASSTPAIFSCAQRTAEPFIRLPKSVLINLYPISNRPQALLVANLHAINFTLGTVSYSEQMANMSSIIEQHTGPVIIAGDFNSWSEARNEIVNAMTEKLALKALAYPQHNRIRVFGHALDHVFYRGLEILSEETLDVSSSDHNPIRVSFRVVEKTL
ncbi:hypothetical protein MNBD_GAMMA10-1758 [hydrothermal vent metagenome]|uniref:Endonuclease/exonuclease/phosphatase domain-containing protein n=1 Tax=hydrothermal vent metagenome TaxID=652676 RepID=A0A3B0XBA0_9ZZZZ